MLKGLAMPGYASIGDVVTLLQELDDRLGNLGAVRNESSIIARQTKKTSHLVNRLWWLPI
jgi:hypothetical protein